MVKGPVTPSSANPVSIIRWRSAKEDPPTVSVYTPFLAMWDYLPTWPHRNSIWVGACDDDGKWILNGDDVPTPVLWSELPVVGDLTDGDMRDVLNMADVALSQASATQVQGLRLASARLRVALGGES